MKLYWMTDHDHEILYNKSITQSFYVTMGTRKQMAVATVAHTTRWCLDEYVSLSFSFYIICVFYDFYQ